MKVYIAASLPLLSFAKIVAEGLTAEGFDVVSTWHAGEPTVSFERMMPHAEKATLANRCLEEIRSADALVLLYDGESQRHGSYLETGYALGLGKRVVAVAAMRSALPTILLLADGVTVAESDLGRIGTHGMAALLREEVRW